MNASAAPKKPLSKQVSASSKKQSDPKSHGKVTPSTAGSHGAYQKVSLQQKVSSSTTAESLCLTSPDSVAHTPTKLSSK